MTRSRSVDMRDDPARVAAKRAKAGLFEACDPHGGACRQNWNEDRVASTGQISVMFHGLATTASVTIRRL